MWQQDLASAPGSLLIRQVPKIESTPTIDFRGININGLVAKHIESHRTCAARRKREVGAVPGIIVPYSVCSGCRASIQSRRAGERICGHGPTNVFVPDCMFSKVRK